MTILPPAEAANPVGSDAAREATAQEVAEAATTLLQQSTESSSLHQIIGTLPGIDMNDPRLLVRYITDRYHSHRRSASVCLFGIYFSGSTTTGCWWKGKEG